MDKIGKHKISKDVAELNNTTNQLHIKDIFIQQ